jgi:hypothetical protein
MTSIDRDELNPMNAASVENFLERAEATSSIRGPMQNREGKYFIFRK